MAVILTKSASDLPPQLAVVWRKDNAATLRLVPRGSRGDPLFQSLLLSIADRSYVVMPAKLRGAGANSAILDFVFAKNQSGVSPERTDRGLFGANPRWHGIISEFDSFPPGSELVPSKPASSVLQETGDGVQRNVLRGSPFQFWHISKSPRSVTRRGRPHRAFFRLPPFSRF